MKKYPTSPATLQVPRLRTCAAPLSHLIGAYNNHWTIELMSVLHFRFTEAQDGIAIQEQVPDGRVWKTKWNSRERSSPWNEAREVQPVTDYAIVRRMKDPSGQYLTILAGIIRVKFPNGITPTSPQIVAIHSW